MATETTHDVALDPDGRLTILRSLLASHPSCVVGVYDAARNLVDVGDVLARIGLASGDHRPIETGLLAQILAVSDVGLISQLALEASANGSAMRSVLLRDGQRADLHFVELDEAERRMVAVFVPDGGSIISSPAATAVVASPRVGALRCDAFGLITSASESVLDLLRRPSLPVVGTSIADLIHPDDAEVAIANWSAAKEQRGVALRWRCRVARDDGSALWVELTITNDIDAAGNGDVCFDLYDISREVAATEALVAERELIELLTETLPVGVAKFDAQGCIEHANRRLRVLLAPLDPQRVLDDAFRGELVDLDLAAAFALLIEDGIGSRHVVDHLGEHGDVRCLEWTIRAALDESGDITGGALCIADVTEAARLRVALERRASTDGLTGCLNRSAAVGALEEALASLGPDEGVALLFIDLDHFKQTNDSRGHAIGDAVLEIVAQRLRAAVRGGDLVGRLGGDEFVVIAPRVESADEALVYAERIARLLHGPSTIDGVDVPIAASIGVAWTSTVTAGELLSAADAAMYIAKQNHAVAPVLQPVA
jgi:diguanylate cyclase (GGDEF)-like protein